MSLNLYKNLPKELKERKGNFVNQINTNDEKYNLVKNNLLNKIILQNELQLNLTNVVKGNYGNSIENNELFNTYLKDKLIHKTIIEWLNIREVEHSLYILTITINPPNTRYTTIPDGSWYPYPYDYPYN